MTIRTLIHESAKRSLNACWWERVMQMQTRLRQILKLLKVLRQGEPMLMRDFTVRRVTKA